MPFNLKFAFSSDFIFFPKFHFENTQKCKNFESFSKFIFYANTIFHWCLRFYVTIILRHIGSVTSISSTTTTCWTYYSNIDSIFYRYLKHSYLWTAEMITNCLTYTFINQHLSTAAAAASMLMRSDYWALKFISMYYVGIHIGSICQMLP